jgi:hypothetical protein
VLVWTAPASPVTSSAMALVPSAASTTDRLISCVVTDCSSTAAARWIRSSPSLPRFPLRRGTRGAPGGAAGVEQVQPGLDAVNRRPLGVSCSRRPRAGASPRVPRCGAGATSFATAHDGSPRTRHRPARGPCGAAAGAGAPGQVQPRQLSLAIVRPGRRGRR